MNSATKDELKSVGKTLAVLAVAGALVGVIADNTLSEKPKTATLLWDYPPEQLDSVIFEVVNKTSLSAPWRFYTNVVATNRMPFECHHPQEFFTISRVMLRDNTNVQAVQRGF